MNPPKCRVRLLAYSLLSCIWLETGCDQAPTKNIEQQAPMPINVSNGQPLSRRVPTFKVTVDSQSISPDFEFVGRRSGSDQYVLNVGIALLVNGQGELNFRWAGAEGERLFLEAADQPPRLV